MPSDLKNYFGFVVDEFSELVHTIKSLRSRHYLSIFICGGVARLQLLMRGRNVPRILTESLI